MDSGGTRPYRPAMTVQPIESILIVDFGSQVTQLIARRVREAGVYCEIAPFNSAEDAFNRLQPKGVIFSGGPASVTDHGSPAAPQVLFDSGLPLLAICYGQQTLHQQLGGTVVTSDQKEFGRAFIDIVAPSSLFDGLWNVGDKHQVWMSHGDRVEALAPGFEVVARSEGAPFAIAESQLEAVISILKERGPILQARLDSRPANRRRRRPRPSTACRHRRCR